MAHELDAKDDERPRVPLRAPDGRIIWVDWDVAPAMRESGWQDIQPQDAATPTTPAQDKRHRFVRRAERRMRAFDDYHYMRGRWISFRRLVEWGASHDERPNYHLLSKAVTGGEFERGGRSLILFMSPAALQAGLLRFSCANANKASGDVWEAAYLSHFWIPRRVCWEWFIREDYEMPPWLAETQSTAVAQVAPTTAKSDRAPKRFSRDKAERGDEDKEWAKAEGSNQASGSDRATEVYLAWISKNTDEGKRPNRDDCIAYMQDQFPDMTEAAVRALRSEHAPSGWTAKGRRRSNNLA